MDCSLALLAFLQGIKSKMTRTSHKGLPIRNLSPPLPLGQGKYEEAKEMHRQTLELREKVLGREHLDAPGQERMQVNVAKLFVVAPSMGDKSSQIYLIIAL